MRKFIVLTMCLAVCFVMLASCGNNAVTEGSSEITEAEATVPVDGNYELTSNSEKATMTADKEFKTVIQITDTYPDDILCVFADSEIASCEFVQWVGNKGSLMFTGLKKGETTLTVYAGVTNDDVTTAKASLTVTVIVEDDPAK